MQGYLNRSIAYLLLGVLLGAFVDYRGSIYAVARDITAQHDAEEKVAEQTRELEVAQAETLQRLALAVGGLLLDRRSPASCCLRSGRTD